MHGSIIVLEYGCGGKSAAGHTDAAGRVEYGSDRYTAGGDLDDAAGIDFRKNRRAAGGNQKAAAVTDHRSNRGSAEHHLQFIAVSAFLRQHQGGKDHSAGDQMILRSAECAGILCGECHCGAVLDKHAPSVGSIVQIEGGSAGTDFKDAVGIDSDAVRRAAGMNTENAMIDRVIGDSAVPDLEGHPAGRPLNEGVGRHVNVQGCTGVRGNIRGRASGGDGQAPAIGDHDAVCGSAAGNNEVSVFADRDAVRRAAAGKLHAAAAVDRGAVRGRSVTDEYGAAILDRNAVRGSLGHDIHFAGGFDHGRIHGGRAGKQPVARTVINPRILACERHGSAVLNGHISFARSPGDIRCRAAGENIKTTVGIDPDVVHRGAGGNDHFAAVGDRDAVRRASGENTHLSVRADPGIVGLAAGIDDQAALVADPGIACNAAGMDLKRGGKKKRIEEDLAVADGPGLIADDQSVGRIRTGRDVFSDLQSERIIRQIQRVCDFGVQEGFSDGKHAELHAERIIDRNRLTESRCAFGKNIDSLRLVRADGDGIARIPADGGKVAVFCGRSGHRLRQVEIQDRSFICGKIAVTAPANHFARYFATGENIQTTVIGDDNIVQDRAGMDGGGFVVVGQDQAGNRIRDECDVGAVKDNHKSAVFQHRRGGPAGVNIEFSAGVDRNSVRGSACVDISRTIGVDFRPVHDSAVQDIETAVPVERDVVRLAAAENGHKPFADRGPVRGSAGKDLDSASAPDVGVDCRRAGVDCGGSAVAGENHVRDRIGNKRHVGAVLDNHITAVFHHFRRDAAQGDNEGAHIIDRDMIRRAVRGNLDTAIGIDQNMVRCAARGNIQIAVGTKRGIVCRTVGIYRKSAIGIDRGIGCRAAGGDIQIATMNGRITCRTARNVEYSVTGDACTVRQGAVEKIEACAIPDCDFFRRRAGMNRGGYAIAGENQAGEGMFGKCDCRAVLYVHIPAVFQNDGRVSAGPDREMSAGIDRGIVDESSGKNEQGTAGTDGRHARQTVGEDFETAVKRDRGTGCRRAGMNRRRRTGKHKTGELIGRKSDIRAFFELDESAILHDCRGRTAGGNMDNAGIHHDAGCRAARRNMEYAAGFDRGIGCRAVAQDIQPAVGFNCRFVRNTAGENIKFAGIPDDRSAGRRTGMNRRRRAGKNQIGEGVGCERNIGPVLDMDISAVFHKPRRRAALINEETAVRPDRHILRDPSPGDTELSVSDLIVGYGSVFEFERFAVGGPGDICARRNRKAEVGP